MVEWVVCGPDGEDWSVGGGCCSAHGCDVWVTHQEPGQQKSASLIG
jgi:hypothetical protein